MSSNMLDNESTADDTHLLTGNRCFWRGGFWETRTRCERRLVILAITMVILIVALIITLIVLEEEQEHKDLSDMRLQHFTEQLISIDKDNNNVFDQLDVNLNGSKLLYGPFSVFTGPTIAPLSDLQSNFHPNVNVPEVFDDNHMKKQKRFLDAIINTEVMKETEKILKDTGLIHEPLVQVLENMWFGLYSRSTTQAVVNGSSGFEHVFVGETNKKKEVSGFHNWVYFFNEQDNPRKPNLTYKGYQGMLKLGNKGDIISMNFTWLNKTKSNGTMFIGTSPELEMAVYTVCFLARPNKECPVSMARKHFNIKTFNFKDTNLVGTAYPDMKSHMINGKYY